MALFGQSIFSMTRPVLRSFMIRKEAEKGGNEEEKKRKDGEKFRKIT
jgi:hypothetical protein